MQLLQELLTLGQADDFDMLLEDLGNLKQLGLGPLVNAFKQTFQKHGRARAERTVTSEVGKKFNHYSGIGRDSEVVEYGPVIKKWAQVKKAITSGGENVKAVAFKLNDKPVALLVIDAYDARSASSAVGLAWDLTKTGMTKEEMETVLAALNKDGGNTYHDEGHADNKTPGRM